MTARDRPGCVLCLSGVLRQSLTWIRRLLRVRLRLFPGFMLAAFLNGLEALFAALGTFSGTLDKLGAHQLQFRELGAIALAGTQTGNAGVAAVALAELCAQLIKQFFHGCRCFEK